jgi:RNA polymerase sigma-70 factor (ECF subfamily)
MVDDPHADAAQEDGFMGLLREAQGGNVTALNGLLAEIRAFMKQVAEKRLRKRMLGKSDASDLVQNCSIKVADHISECRATTKAQFLAWVETIAEREYLDEKRYAKQQKRNVARQVPLPEDSHGEIQVAGDASSPSQRARRNEASQRGEAILRQLSPDDQLIIRLKHQEDRPWPEIAAVLECSEAAARRRYYRAVERLKKKADEQP